MAYRRSRYISALFFNVFISSRQYALIVEIYCALLSAVSLIQLMLFADGAFELLEITDLSTPPDLPEVMKPQESVSSHPQD